VEQSMITITVVTRLGGWFIPRFMEPLMFEYRPLCPWCGEVVWLISRVTWCYKVTIRATCRNDNCSFSEVQC
jgi:hypothetical protein